MLRTPAEWDEMALLPDAAAAAGWTERGMVERHRRVGREVRDLAWGKPLTLLDYGCGPGMLADALPSDVQYTGYDWSKGMRERASARGLHIVDRPQLQYDIGVAVGTWNTAPTMADALHGIASLWRHSDRAMIVSLYRGTDPRCLRFDPAWAARAAATLHCSRYRIDCSYLENDLLLVMLR